MSYIQPYDIVAYVYSDLYTVQISHSTAVEQDSKQKYVLKLNLSLILFPAAQTFAMVGMVADHAGNADAKQHPMVQANSTLVLTISFLTFLVADMCIFILWQILRKGCA